MTLPLGSFLYVCLYELEKQNTKCDEIRQHQNLEQMDQWKIDSGSDLVFVQNPD